MLDLKIKKTMPWNKFQLLLQKLALDTWNKTFNNIFEAQRRAEIRKTAEEFKLECFEDNPQLADEFTTEEFIAC